MNRPVRALIPFLVAGALGGRAWGAEAPQASPGAPGEERASREEMAPRQTTLKELDAHLATVPPLLQEVRRAAAERGKVAGSYPQRSQTVDGEKFLAGLAARCRSGFTVPGMEAELGKSWASADIRGHELQETWVLYRTCLALAAGSAAACGGGVPPDDDARERDKLKADCEKGFATLTVAGTLVAGTPGFLAKCRSALPSAMNLGRDPKAPEILCGLLDKHRGNLDAFCAALERTAPVKDCREQPFYRMAMGSVDPRFCSYQGTPEGVPTLQARHECEALNALRAAGKAGKSSLCGDSGLCAALMGGGTGSCATYSTRMRSLFCGRIDPKTDAGNRMIVAESRRVGDKDLVASRRSVALDQLYAQSLSQARAAIDMGFKLLDEVEPKSTPGLDDRLKKLVSLQDALNAEASKVPGYKAPPKTPRSK